MNELNRKGMWINECRVQECLHAESIIESNQMIKQQGVGNGGVKRLDERYAQYLSRRSVGSFIGPGSYVAFVVRLCCEDVFCHM